MRVAVILMQTDKILLVRRAGSYADRWCIPCGYVEWDEDVRQTAAREMKEETGLDAQEAQFFSMVEVPENMAFPTDGLVIDEIQNL